MMKRFFAMILALAMLLSVSAVFAEESADADPVPDTLLVTVNGVEIRENDEALQSYLNEILLDDDGYEDFLHLARMYAMIDVIQTLLIEQKTEEANITDEEMEAFKGILHERWNMIVDSFTNDVLTQMYGISPDNASEDDLISAKTYALSYLESYYGYTEDIYVEENANISNAFAHKLSEELKANDPSLTATEEEILQYYNEMAMEEMESIGNDVASYESFQQYYQNFYGYTYEFHFIPEGYRGILHILLKVDQELLDNWTGLTARLEESLDPEEATDETADDATAEPEEPVTEEMIEAARQAILDSQKEKLEAIAERLEKGESFESLIAEYGEDPGMLDEEYLKNGYMVHKDSIMYDADFTKAAAALEKVGDVSAPVVSQFGIHILYYLRDVPAGIIDISDDEYAQLQSEIEDERLNLAISNLLDQWVEEADIVYTEEGEAWRFDEEAINAYYDYYDSMNDYYFEEDEAETEEAVAP